MSTNFAIEDRKSQYQIHKDRLWSMEQKTEQEIIDEYKAEIEAWRVKVQQQKERLEALGVTFE